MQLLGVRGDAGSRESSRVRGYNNPRHTPLGVTLCCWAKSLSTQRQIFPTLLNNLCFKLLEMCLLRPSSFPSSWLVRGHVVMRLHTFCLQPPVQQTLPLVNVVTPQSCLTTASLCSQKEKSNTAAAFCPRLHCRWHCETKILGTKMCFAAPFQTLIAV